MTNYINYFTNQTVDLFYSFQPSDNGVPIQRDWRIPALRIGKIAIPLMMLYKPFAKPVSMGLGSIKTVVHLASSIQAIKKMEGWKFAAEAGQSGLAAVSLANFYFQSRLCGVFTTSVDMVQSLYMTSCHYQERKFSLMIEDLLQIAGAACYIAFLAYGSSTAVLSFIAAQAVLSLYKTRQSWMENKTPEAFVNFIIASFRFYEGKQEWNRIPKQDDLNTPVKSQTEDVQKSREEENQFPKVADQNESASPEGVKKEEPLQDSSSQRSFQKTTSPIEAMRRMRQLNLPEEIVKSSELYKILRILPKGTLKPLLEHPKGESARMVMRLGLSVFRGKDEPVDPRLQLMMNALDSRRIKQRLLSFPLQNFQNVNENAAILKDAEGNEYNFGAHYHGFGKGLVKGANLCFKEKGIDGKEMIELDFKINHVFRNKMQEAISLLSNRDTSVQMSMLSNLTGSPIKKISVQEGFYEMGGFEEREASQIMFNGVGSILVGSNPEEVGLYNRVIVRIPKDCTLFELNKMLSLVGLEDTLMHFTAADLDRLKIGYLFRHFLPNLATPFERTPEFFKLSVPELKAAIIEQDPDMQDLFETYMPRFKPHEILPGRIRYGIEGVGDRCYELGARSLISSVLIRSNEKDQLNKIVSILKMGMLSSEMRFGNEINSKGLSPDRDLEEGSADSVFTQLVTVSDYENNETPSLKKFNYFEPEDCIALEFDLSILDTMTYQYHDDSYGTRDVSFSFSPYLRRPNIYDFVTGEVNAYHGGNELMVRERIPPSFITGIWIANHELREHLEQQLRDTGLIQTHPDSVETIFDVPVSQFIRTPSTADIPSNNHTFFL